MRLFRGTFRTIEDALRGDFLLAPEVRTERWQGVAANQDTIELQNVEIEVDLRGIEDLDHWRAEIRPNLPWADDHFRERVGGVPLNPGEQWAKWPWGQSANRFRTAEKFNHTYMERLWPKFARREAEVSQAGHIRKYPGKDNRPHMGIAHYLGDLEDLVDLLAKEPHTRQAWIPLFFPEDTGIGDGGRKPCTLGYQVLVRQSRASIWYPLRSCDLVRHWADDCYLAVRMLLWITDRCRERSEAWKQIVPGTYNMHCTSLHAFATDRQRLWGDRR